MSKFGKQTTHSLGVDRAHSLHCRGIYHHHFQHTQTSPPENCELPKVPEPPTRCPTPEPEIPEPLPETPFEIHDIHEEVVPLPKKENPMLSKKWQESLKAVSFRVSKNKPTRFI
jgi:hypothetical protein